MFIPKSHVAGFSGSLVQLREFHRHASCLVSLRNTRGPLKVRLYQYTILQIVISLHVPLDVDFALAYLTFYRCVPVVRHFRFRSDVATIRSVASSHIPDRVDYDLRRPEILNYKFFWSNGHPIPELSSVPPCHLILLGFPLAYSQTQIARHLHSKPKVSPPRGQPTPRRHHTP